jgi:predicted RND superfamily exporter protein
VAEVNQALHGGDPAHYRVPDDERALSDVLLLCQFSGNDELKKLATPDLRQARVRVGLVTQSDRKNRQAMALIDQESVRHFSKLKANVAVTGLVPMWIAISGYLASSEAEALSITAAVVALVLGIAFRSIALGVRMAALNAAVVCVTLGMMGWFKIALDPYTMLVASIALGILDDDSVHLVRDVQRRYDASRDLEQSVVAALSDSAPGLLFFSVSLICGCLVYFLSDVASLTKFGGLVAFTLALGALIEFVASPAILLMIGPRLFQRGETLLPATSSTLTSRG